MRAASRHVRQWAASLGAPWSFVVLILVLIASPALAAGDIGAMSPSVSQPRLDAANGEGPVGWVNTVSIAAPRGDAAFGMSAHGLLRIDRGGSLRFWPVQGAAATGGAAQFGKPLDFGLLPDAIPSPVIVPTQTGFVIMGQGGAGVGRTLAYFVSVQSAQGKLGQIIALPDLPVVASFPSGTVLGGRLITTDTSGAVHALDVEAVASGILSQPRWTRLTALPLSGQPGLACDKVWLAVQYDGEFDRLHAICTRAGANSVKLSLWRWLPNGAGDAGIWRAQTGAELPGAAAQVQMVSAQGQANIVAFAAPAANCAATGCAASLLIYNTVIDRWREMDAAYPAGVLSNLVAHDLQVHALSPASGGFTLSQFAFRPTAKRFGWLDMSVVALYLVSMVLVGWWFKSRNNSTEEFFRGGQSIPWWAAALAIHAALLSSLTYLGLPALVFRTSWIMLMGMVILIPVTLVIARWVMPFFRRIDATSAYEYLSLRFNMPMRQMASALFAIFHVGRIAIVLSLAGLALASVTPLAAWQSVLLMGVLSIAYSSMGGVEAVIWTEALQTLVLTVGALVCFFFLLDGIDGGFSSYVSQGLADGKFKLADWNFSQGSWLTFSIWVIVLGGIGQNLSTYGADQSVIQRYLVTSTEEKAAKAIWLNALTTAPSALIFFLIGTGLYYFYQAHPARLDPSIQIDQIFPSFIASEVPTGVAGLIIAGVFAATQSTVATSMHSISTTLVVDFLRPSRLNWSDQAQLHAARGFTVLIGTIGTLVGLVFINPAIRSLFEAYMAVVGMSMGALGGLFLAGMTTKRVSSLSAFLGLCGGIAIMIALWRTNAINPYLFSAVGVFSCYGLAWLLSFVTGPSRNDLDNLTVMTMRRAGPTPASVKAEAGA